MRYGINPLATALLLCACGEKEETGFSCEMEIDETFPAQDAQDFYQRASLELQLSEPDTGMETTVALEGPQGAVAGELSFSEDLETVHFAPQDILEPSAAYDATITTCAGQAVLSFGTSALGLPLTVSLEGRSYALGVSDGRFLEPEDIGPLLAELGDFQVLLGVVSEGDSLQLMGAMAVEGSDPPEQDLCLPTIEFPSAEFGETPYFEIEPADIMIQVGDLVLPLYQVEMAGTFAADGGWFGGGQLAGELDARDIAAAFDELEDGDALCALADSFGVSCEACSTGGDLYCLTIKVDQLVAQEVELTLVEVTDPSADKACQEKGAKEE